MIVKCANPECPEFLIEKDAHGISLPDGVTIGCGYCNFPVVDANSVVVIGPIDLGPIPPQPPNDAERLTDLEAFDAQLVDAIEALTQRVAALEAGT